MPTSQTETEQNPNGRGHKGRAAGIVGVLTVCVSLVGYLREATLAARFGISSTMDAYFAAIFIPTMLYGVLILGTVSPVFIPILIQDDPEENPGKASATFSVITTFVLLILASIVTVGVLSASRWLPWLFPGFAPATSAMTLRLVYIIFPTLPMLASAGILTALLNGYHKFSLAAMAPAFASLPVIAAALWARSEYAIYIVGAATAAGFLLQFVVLVPATWSVGIRYRPVFNFRHPAVVKLLRLGVPLFLYLLMANASLVLERNFASRISAGAVATLTYAFRLFTVPANFLAAPLAIVAFPGFAREAARENRGDLAGQSGRIFRMVVFLFVPITVWTIINANPITRLLYEHGRFLAADSSITARILAIYSLGILPNAIAAVLLRCFFAIEDTITPLLAEIFDLAFFIVVGFYLSRRMGLEGLVAARCMTFFVVMTILVGVLVNKQILRLDREFKRLLFFTALATVTMGLVSWLSLRMIQPYFSAGGTVLRMAVVGGELALSAAVFFSMARLFRLEQAQQIVSTVKGLLPGPWKRATD